MSDQINNKRIAKNTLFLYARQLVIMIVSLYTSRVILQVLGVEDFGIYNVVGGVIVMFTFLNSSLSNATQRFLNFEMGKENEAGVNKIFCMSVNLHLLFAIAILILSETIGLWFIYNKVNIAQDRMFAALWAYQFSIASLCLQMLRVPFGATIVSYERMDFYAYLSILDVVLRLGVVFLLALLPFDKLIIYAALIPIINLCILMINILYVHSKFETAHFKFLWDGGMFKQMVSFSGWSLLGGLSGTCSNYGLNLIMNIFCGVVVNAAMGIANQVNAALGSLVSSFQTAFAPQIVKSYAAGDTEGYYQLIIRTSKFSFFIMLIFAVPVVIFAAPLIHIWLTNVPDYAITFTQLVILYTLIDSLSGPFWHACNATGNVKEYYIVTSILLFATLPIAYLLLINGVSVIWAVAARVILNIVIHYSRVRILRNLTGFPSLRYWKEILYYVMPAIIISIVLWYVPWQFDCLYVCCIEILLVLCIVTCSCIFLGLSSMEKKAVLRLIRKNKI